MEFDSWKKEAKTDSRRIWRMMGWIGVPFEILLKDWIFLVLNSLLPLTVVFTTTKKEDIFDSCKQLTFYFSVILCAKFLIMDLRLKRLHIQAVLGLSSAFYLFFGLSTLAVMLATSDLSLAGAGLFVLASILEALLATFYNSLFLLKMRSRLTVVISLVLLLGGVWLNFWINGTTRGGRAMLPFPLQVAVTFLVPPVFSGATGRCILQ